MIAFVIVSIALLGVLAVVVGVVDAAQAFRRRQIAAERRERWENRRFTVDHFQDF